MNNENLKTKIQKEEDWRAIDSLQKDLKNGEIIIVVSDNKAACSILHEIIKKELHWNSPLNSELRECEILETTQMMKSALIGSGVYSIVANELSPQGVLNHIEMLLDDTLSDDKVVEIVTIKENNEGYYIEDVFTLPY